MNATAQQTRPDLRILVASRHAQMCLEDLSRRGLTHLVSSVTYTRMSKPVIRLHSAPIGLESAQTPSPRLTRTRLRIVGILHKGCDLRWEAR